MSIHRSLKSSGALSRQRSVLTRTERIKILEDHERWKEGDPVLGLPKVKVARVRLAKKKKEKAEEGEVAEVVTKATK
ncbi:MAG: small basic protein [Planctomycetota bacterium]|nr:small basic protein [Planctomycetota bacterium]MDA1138877.1 small basic protein [Planctomycetota bacterium]